MSQQVLTFAGSPLSGTAMIAALETKLQSLASNRSGTSRPSDIVAGEEWLDTTTATAWLVKRWDGVDDIVTATINSTTNAVTFPGTATSGANSNITSLSGLTTPLSVAQGGTGVTTAGFAGLALSASKIAATDSGSLATLLSVGQGLAVSSGALNATGPNIAIGSFSRDMATASGGQSITGLSFTPKFVFFLSAVTNAAGQMSIGFDMQSGRGCLRDQSPAGAAGAYQISSPSVNVVTSSGGTDQYAGQISSMDSGGFTLAWTKIGSPTGIITNQYFAIG